MPFIYQLPYKIPAKGTRSNQKELPASKQQPQHSFAQKSKILQIKQKLEPATNFIKLYLSNSSSHKEASKLT